MDLNWIPTSIAILVTLAIALLTHQRERNRDRRQDEVTERRDIADEQRRVRDSEKEAVLRIFESFAEARQIADRPEHSYEGPQPDFGDAFPESWEATYYSRLKDAEQISDAPTRLAFQDALQAIYWCGGLDWFGAHESKQSWGGARTIVKNCSAIGFVVAGHWLRNEPLSADTERRVKEVSDMLAAYDALQEKRNRA